LRPSNQGTARIHQLGRLVTLSRLLWALPLRVILFQHISALRVTTQIWKILDPREKITQFERWTSTIGSEDPLSPIG
jgi:hypothetical protein